MKRFLVLLLSIMIVCNALILPAAATQLSPVISPEYSEEIEIPDDPIPLGPGGQSQAPSTPTSPQTGYEMGIMGLMAVAVICSSAAVFTGKKAFQK